MFEEHTDERISQMGVNRGGLATLENPKALPLRLKIRARQVSSGSSLLHPADLSPRDISNVRHRKF